MADSQTDSKFFSVRIVSIDYYMTAPLPGFDICYSSFQGGRVNEVPVIRVYGATPGGQKTCLHLHGALPYFYVPCSELVLQSDQKGNECTNALALALEKVLKLKGNAGSKRQHVHGCSLVRARKFYGHHSSEELFLKIYLYHPQDVSRAANLLLGGAVLDKSLQPHESHIPFLLQFLVDYNLYGMGHLHVSKMKFRNPIPDTFSPRKANCVDRRRPSDMSTSTTTEFQVDLDGESCFNMPIWISSTIPDNWMWKFSSQADPSTDPDIPNIKRQSISELEGDASVDAIMNQQLISYMSLSQTGSQEKMVQSLIPIWEEEFARNGVHEVGLPPDPGKPLQDDVLRTLSLWIGYEEILMELSNDVKVSSDMLQSINLSMNDGNIANIGHCGSLNSIREPSRCPEEGLFQDHVLEKIVGTDACPKQLLADQLEATVSMVASQDVKASDQDALRLLNWLASSQAAEDINSDDDLARETILSPLMPATTIDTVLEKANVAYENESQQECEDILDSVHDCYFEELDRKTSQSISNDHSCRSSSSMMIPQLDGSNDDPSPISFVNESSETQKKTGTSSQADSWNKATLVTSNKHKKKKTGWCSLAIALGQNLNDSHPNPVNTPSSHICDERDGRGTSSHMNFNKYSNFLTRSSKESANCEVESSMIVECSTRDLMRVNRSYQAEPSEYGNQVKKVQLGAKGKEDSSLNSESIHDEKEKMPHDFLISRSAITDQPRECHERNSFLALQLQVEPGDIKADKSSSPPYHKLPLLSSSMQENASKDKVFLSSEGQHVEVGSRASAGLQNYGTSGASTSQGTKDLFQLPDVENQKSAIYMGICGCCSCENVDSCVICTKISNPDLCTSRVAPYSRFTSETEEKFPGCGKLLQKNAVGLSQSPASPSRSISTVIDVSGYVLELKGMTFIKKPPKVEFTDEPRRNAQSACDTPSYHVNKKNKTRTCAQDRGLDECPPFFEGNCLVGEKISSANCGTSNYVPCQDNLLGVPVHYQNDGSYLYMLTPVYSPPRSESVRRWLSLDCADSSKMDVVSVPPVYPSTKVCSDDIAESQDCQSTFCDQPLMDSASASEPNPNQLQANKKCQESNSVQMNPVVPDARIKQDEEIILKCEPSMRGSQDLSQISGPDRKSRLTPLSQTGFRDPASIGCGQQLTILSIEVQAESRGDLRPDPRFDAVRIIVLVFQEDDDFRSDTHVLLHCNGESVQRDLDGVSECKVLAFIEERRVFFHFIKMINSFDPDIFMGWDIQGGSLGFLAERAAYLGIGLLNKISRTPSEGNIASRDSEGGKLSDIFSEAVAADPMFHEDAAIIDDEWGRTHASGVHVGGRIVLNIWRLMRGEVKLNLYTLEAMAEAVLRRKIPYIPNKVLTNWFLSGPGRARYRCIEYILERTKLNLQIMNQLDVVNRTSELARIFGIDFFSVLSRGSQYRVESMFLRLAHAQNYVAISPGNQQVASQPAMECIPLVMEPKSGFYADPVVVLDFQSLYPSMIIAYNLCFCTCLGKVTSTKANILGVSSYSPDKNVMHNLKDEILLTPNGVMYMPPKVRKGVLPRLLEEILDTRIMVKTAMKKLAPGQQVLHRIFNARQLALKLIANVTYGYTAAGFSGRMPCAELADSIVQCARRTLESAISFVNTNHRWNAKVIYGDTDSMFVLLEGRSAEEAFRIGHEIASEVTAMNPKPVTLKMEKVYHSCFLLTKKRYVGYSYENIGQSKPVFDAKGIETVRRDTCGAVSKIMERSLRVFFEYRDIEKVKSYLVRQWKKIISGRVSLQDFVFAKEVRLGTYSAQASSLPPAAIVATKAMRVDPRAEPRYAERVPYVVVHGEPGARLADVVVDPLDVLSIDSPYRLNDIYYIKKQIIPALQRVFGLVRADLNQWFSDMPRPEREAAGKRHRFTANAHRTRIDYYYLSKHCIICGELIQASSYICQNCSRNEAVVAAALTGRTSVLERNIQHLAAICRHCGGGDWLIESGVKCTSLACSVFYERRKIQKELQSLSAVTTEAGFYPRILKMTLVDIIFNYGGEWIKKPNVMYSKKLIDIWTGVQQLIVTVPSGNYYEIDGDNGIRQLLYLVSEEFKVLNIYAVDEGEELIEVHNISQHSESYVATTEVGTTEVGTDGESDNESDDNHVEVEYDSDDLNKIAFQKNRIIDETLLDYKELCIGMSFKDIPEARLCINLYALVNKRNLKQLKSDPSRLRYECVAGCRFSLHISGDKDMPGVRIKTLKNTHDCNEAFDNGRVDHLTIAYYFKSKLQNDPKYRIKDMRDDLEKRFDVNVSHGKCKRAKRLILEKLEGSFTDDYNRLEAYANELRSSNPGSDVIINISKDALANGKRRFLRMFICFHALKMGFKDGLRPFIGLDGTFLKGKAKGQLLTAVGQDCQSHSYLIAWAVVDKETKRTWNWFLGHLKRSLDLKEVGEGITFISDMQKGLLQAMKDVFPESHHRFCAKHVEANWCKTWRSEELQKVFWWCSWTTYEEDFKDKLNMIGSLDKTAAEDLLKYPPNAWCRAYFDTVCKNYEVVNNFTESVNKWILEARGKPIIKMLEEIRTKVMNQLRKREDEVRFWATEFSPKSMQLFNEYMKIAQKCKVNFNGDYGYEITEGCDRHTVNMILKRCTCRQWDLNGIPCPHAISAMLYNKLDPLSEMSWWYSREAFMLTYRHKL